jgi:hypothetical protein
MSARRSIRPLAAALAVAAPMLAARVTAAEPPPATRRIALSLSCDEIVASRELTAALALELAPRWHLVTPATSELILELTAAPCAPDAPLTLLVRTPDGSARALASERLVLPRRERARALALLIAELLPEAAAALAAPPPPPAPLPSPPSPAAPSPTAPAPSPAAPSPAAPAPASDARSLSVPTPALAVDQAGAPPARSGTFPVELALTLIRRGYDHPRQNGIGLRLAAARALPLPRARGALDLGIDEVSTPYGFDLRAGRAGVQLGVRFAPARRLAIDAAARGEFTLAQVFPAISDLMIDRRWIAATAGGGLLGLGFAVSPTVYARLELEAGAVLVAHDLVTQFRDPTQPPPTHQAALTSYLAVSAGVAFR